MICYRDRTFCDSNVEKHECGRELTDEVIDGAVRWWGGADAPIATGKFCKE